MKQGQRFRHSGQIFVIAYVNVSRAHCVSESSADALDISPDSLVEVLS